MTYPAHMIHHVSNATRIPSFYFASVLPCRSAMSLFFSLTVSPPVSPTLESLLFNCTGTYLTYSGWHHLSASCPDAERPGWSTSAVCPMTKRLVRLMITQAAPFTAYKAKRMVVQHVLPGAAHTLRPQNKFNSGPSRSMVDFGYVRTVSLTCNLQLSGSNVPRVRNL